jgi:predicted ATPase
MAPEQQRRRLLATIVAWILRTARAQPLVIVTEDLHWADPSTLELTHMLVEQGAMSSLLLLYTARTEFRSHWSPRAHHTQITLNRLSARDVRAMIAEVAARAALAEETVAAVVARTAGVPLFVEELTRAVLEHGVAANREIPSTLHDSLMARLDRLGAAKEVAQVAAVLGRDFSYELLHAVHSAPEDKLLTALKALTDAELLYVRGIPPEATYTFKHALIQDAAYEALLKVRRRELHRHVASVVIRQFPELAEAQPELLAHHYTEAGLSLEAIPQLQRAGQRALERSAHVEAIGHLTKGLELLGELPDADERASDELALQTALGHALTATRGWSDPRAGKAYIRSVELCQQLGDRALLFRALYCSFQFHTEMPQLKKSIEQGQQLLSLAEQMTDQSLLEVAHYGLGFTLFFRGEFVAARNHLQQGIAANASVRAQSRAFPYGYDPRMPYWFVSACTLWVMGYADQALERARNILALIHEVSHPYSSAVGLYWAAIFYRLRREMPSTREQADALIALSTEQGFTMTSAFGSILRGSVLAEQGASEDALAQIEQGIAAHRASGGALRQTFWLALLAEAHAKAGHFEQALTVLAEALNVVSQTGERWCEAELYRLKGELLLRRDDSNAAEAQHCLVHAIEIARNQTAKSFELRATISLARLLAKLGRCDEARAQLAEIYGWFTEGFDTPDLKDAKALLDELSA